MCVYLGNCSTAAPRCGPYTINANEPGYVIRGADYTDKVGEQRECTWFILASHNATAVQLTVETLQLAVIPKPNVSKFITFNHVTSQLRPLLLGTK